MCAPETKWRWIHVPKLQPMSDKPTKRLCNGAQWGRHESILVERDRERKRETNNLPTSFRRIALSVSVTGECAQPTDVRPDAEYMLLTHNITKGQMFVSYMRCPKLRLHFGRLFFTIYSVYFILSFSLSLSLSLSIFSVFFLFVSFAESVAVAGAFAVA